MLPVYDVFQWTGLVKFYLGQFVSLFRWSMCSQLSCTFFSPCIRLITLGFQTKANMKFVHVHVQAKQCRLINLPVMNLTQRNEEAIPQTSSICFAMNGCRPTQNYLRNNNCLGGWSVLQLYSHWTKYSLSLWNKPRLCRLLGAWPLSSSLCKNHTYWWNHHCEFHCVLNNTIWCRVDIICSNSSGSPFLPSITILPKLHFYRNGFNWSLEIFFHSTARLTA